MNKDDVSFNVCLMQPAGYIHSLALLEAAEYIVAKIRGAGFDVRLTKNRIRSDGINIVFGAHINPSESLIFPRNTVIFNTEQLTESSNWTQNGYRSVIEKYPIWDYSETNLEQVPHKNKFLINFSYEKELARIDHAEHRDIDLLFYGSLSDRRIELIEKIKKKGLKVEAIFGLYANERDEMLKRSKSVLNLHYYDSQILQQIRIFYPLINAIPVISENYPLDTAPNGYENFIFTPSSTPIEDYVEFLFSDLNNFYRESSEKYKLFIKAEDNSDVKSALNETIAILKDQTPVIKPVSTIPAKMNLGSGKDYRVEYLNVDINPRLDPDVLIDLSGKINFPMQVDSPRFGSIRLEKNSFDEIIANDVLEHIPNLVGAMENCLSLLKPGGKFIISVPYELSYGAWQDPTHIRAFNEKSWLYYTEWFWYLGWFEYRFDCIESTLNLSEIGQHLISSGVSQDVVMRTTRAVDSMRVVLAKRETTPQEKTLARSYQHSL